MGICETVYLNGEFLPLAAARISPLDRGFLFGDGIYEVIPVYSGRPFRLAEHLRRLATSLTGIRLENPLTEAEWGTAVHRQIDLAMAAGQGEDLAVYLQLTRGADSFRDHPFPDPPVPPTVFMFAAPLVTPAAAVRARGVAAVTAVDNRWLRCDLKAVSLLANVLLRQQAVDARCAECLLLREGYLTEGSSSSIFIMREGVLRTPAKGHLMLPGVTYDVILELAAANAWPVQVGEISEAELRGADEVWMTSSTKEILSIVRLDDKPVGNGQPGPGAARMYELYQQFKATVMRGPHD